MKITSALIEELQNLENLLSSGASSIEQTAQLLADNCIEFGASGRRFNKQQILEAIEPRNEQHRTFSEFDAQSLGPNVVLLTYRERRLIDGTPKNSLRSSIWRKDEGMWQLLFHQGTPTSI